MRLELEPEEGRELLSLIVDRLAGEARDTEQGTRHMGATSDAPAFRLGWSVHHA